MDDAFYFTSGQDKRKDKNLAANANCTLATIATTMTWPSKAPSPE